MQNFSDSNNPDRQCLERAGDVTCAYDLRGNIIFLSPEGERITGYTCAEARRMNIAELLDPEIAGRVLAQILRDEQTSVGTVTEIEIIAKNGRRVCWK
jgi:PAS domain S-box-containing protein